MTGNWGPNGPRTAFIFTNAFLCHKKGYLGGGAPDERRTTRNVGHINAISFYLPERETLGSVHLWAPRKAPICHLRTNLVAYWPVEKGHKPYPSVDVAAVPHLEKCGNATSRGETIRSIIYIDIPIQTDAVAGYSWASFAEMGQRDSSEFSKTIGA